MAEQSAAVLLFEHRKRYHDRMTASQPALHRLDPNVMPKAYRVALDVDPGDAGFSGKVAIDLQLAEAQKQIVLHARNLLLMSIDCSGQAGKVISTEPNGTIVLSFKNPVERGDAILTIAFRGRFSEGLEGAYLVEGDDKNAVFTQFQAIGARKAFPCFDEPGFKATFEFTLTTPDWCKAVSNSPAASVTQGVGKTVHHFAPTIPIATYALAFAVGDFDIVEHDPVLPSQYRPTPIPLRGIATRGEGDGLAMVLARTAELVLMAEDYFATPYPFAKLDILAVPDMAAEGMENAGLITYQEDLALIDSDTGFEHRRTLLTTHAHEIIHQWFGNLITPKWWDDLWLNESFATLLEAKFSAQAEPSWRYETDLLTNMHEAMLVDMLPAARRVREPVLTDDDITFAFDVITYQKGSAVLAMVEDLVGDDQFRNFVRKLLAKHKLKNFDRDDFVTELKSLPQGAAAAQLLNSFINQPGLPVLTMENELLRQAPLRTANAQENATYAVWNFELPFTKAGTTATCDIFFASSSINFPPACKPALPQIAFGTVPHYFAVGLSDREWQKIFVSWPVMAVPKALAFANSFDLALAAGSLSLPVYMEGARALSKHADWAVAGFPLSRLEFLALESDRSNAAVFISKLYGSAYQTVSFIKSPSAKTFAEWQRANRTEDVLSVFALMGSAPETSRALAQAGTMLIQGGNTALDKPYIGGEMVAPALIAALINAEDDLLKRAIALLSDNHDAHQRENLLHAICASRSQRASQYISDLLLSDDLRNQELPTVLGSRARFPAFRPELLEILQHHAVKLLDRLDGDDEISIIQACDSFTSEDHARRLEAIVTPLLGELQGGAPQLQLTLQRIRANAALLQHLGLA